MLQGTALSEQERQQRMSPSVPAGLAWLATEGFVVPLAYLVSCSAMLVTNKLCVHRVPAPSFVAGVQFLSVSGFCMMLQLTGAAKVDALVWPKVKPYLLYVLVFFGAIYFNMAALRVASVGTLLVVRACCPLCVCVVEWLALGRRLPSLQSVLALVVVALSALVYVRSDKEVQLQQGWFAQIMIASYL